MGLVHRLLLLIGCATLAFGCARSTSVTEVTPSGAWKRTVTLAIVDPMAPPETDGATVTTSGPKIEDVFELPTGKEWKITSDWYTGDDSVLVPMVKETSEKYAADKKIEAKCL